MSDPSSDRLSDRVGAPAPDPAATRARLTGWGRTAPSVATVWAPADADAATAAVAAAGARGIVARGLGRSYGDAAQNAGGDVLDLRGLDRVLHLDGELGSVTAEAGISLDALLRLLVPLGWFVPVTPGTRFVTLGGAIASDIHGKNHHVEGSIGQHVTAMELLLADGSIVELTPADDDFWATTGGMGLTGVVLRATVRLLPIETASLLVETSRMPDLEHLMAAMESGDDRYRYSVAWVDTLARGGKLGRSVLTRGDHATRENLPVRRRGRPLAYGPTPRLRAPSVVPSRLLNLATIGAFNEAWFRKAPRSHVGVESIPTFFHPLDGVADWNALYGARGFVQHQFVVPRSAGSVVRTALERLSAARTPSFLAVLKRFGAESPGPLSFPAPGWTLALDIPARLPGLARLLDGLDELVAEAGGRVYLSKDARLRPDLLSAMYPRLPQWREQRGRLDPKGVFTSDLSRRLQLT